METHTAPKLGDLQPGGRCSRYQIIETADGFLVEGRERVPVRVALSASRTSLLITDDTKNYADEVGVYAYRPLLSGIASRVMGQWSQPADRPESPWSGMSTWAVSQTRKALSARVFQQWQRLLAAVPEQVRLVAKATFAATGNDSTLGCEAWHELYDYPFLVQDILRFRAAAAACRQPFPMLVRAALVTRLRASDQEAWRQGRFARIYDRFWLPWRGGREATLSASEEYAIFERTWRYSPAAFLQTMQDPQDRRLVLETLASDWKGCFSSTGQAYRSLNRTLMGLPGAVSTSLLSYLPTITLERPMTDRVELLFLLLYARMTGTYAPDSRCEYRIFARASRKDILAALRRLGEHTRQELRPKSAHLLTLVQVLCDYCQQGEHSRGTIPGLLDRALRWHRDLQERYVKDTIGQLDRETATARPPVALPAATAIRFLSTVGEVIEEGVTMQHCIASFARWAADGQGYLFHVEHQGESASVQVDRWGQVVQAYGPRNTLNVAADYGRRLLTRWGSPLREALPNPPGLDNAPLDEILF
jgi:hypothetical protein